MTWHVDLAEKYALFVRMCVLLESSTLNISRCSFPVKMALLKFCRGLRFVTLLQKHLDWDLLAMILLIFFSYLKIDRKFLYILESLIVNTMRLIWARLLSIKPHHSSSSPFLLRQKHHQVFHQASTKRETLILLGCCTSNRGMDLRHVSML
jgi:hypothetical protein